MDTTLVTFYLKTSADVISVELLGSWDNFKRPYRLTRDTLRGYGTWCGNFKFENIIFDGDKLDWRKPRTGGLKQGGRYWYYYRLDDEEEYCDSAQPTSTACPLLPGQTTNVLDVPREVIQPASRSRSASADFISFFPVEMTLDPEDRYKKVEKPAPTKLPRHYASTEALQPHAIQAQHETSPSNSSASGASGPRSSASGGSESDCSTGCDDSRTSSPVKEDAPPPSSPLRRWKFKLAKLRRFGPAASETTPERPSTRSGAPSTSERSFESLAAFPVPSTQNKPDQPLQTVDITSEQDMDPQKIAPTGRGLGIDIGHHGAFDGPALQSTYISGAQSFHLPARISHRAPPPSLSGSYEDGCEEEAMSLAGAGTLSLSPSSQTTGLDVNSPTFTAATLSSSGFDSPDRLSHDYTFEDCRTHYEPSIIGYEQDDLRRSVEDVAEQFAGLHTGNEHDFATPRSNPFVNHHFLTPTNNSSSPAPSSSQLTLKKSPSDCGKESANDDTLLSDDIFGEFHYLTHVIN